MEKSELIQKALRNYDLVNPEIEFIRHNENLTYSISDSSRKYLLRIHDPSTPNLLGVQHSFKGIESEISVIRHLRSLSLNFQKPVPCNDGSYIGTIGYKDIEYHHTALEWIEGDMLKNRTMDSDIAYSIGSAIGKMHDSLKNVSNTSDFARPVYDQRFRNQMAENIREGIKAGIVEEKHIAMITEFFQLLENRTAALHKNDDQYGLIHGDVNFSNLILDNQNNVNIIDFGFFGFGFFLRDLAYVIELKPEFRDDYIRGYGLELSDANIALIEGFMLELIFSSYGLLISNHKFHKWIRNDLPRRCNDFVRRYIDGKSIFYEL